ncbi:MAG: hypothetical protein KA310_03340 [Pseudomonadales bacterium]|nr:hypothetical protein [Pseudomonadales bacterium]
MKWKRVRGGVAGAYLSFRGNGRRAPFRLVSQPFPGEGARVEWAIYVRGAWIGLRASVEQAQRDCAEFYEVYGRDDDLAREARRRKAERNGL